MIYKITIPIFNYGHKCEKAYYIESNRCPYYNEVLEIICDELNRKLSYFPFSKPEEIACLKSLEYVKRWPFLGILKTTSNIFDHPELGKVSISIEIIKVELCK